MGNFTQTTGDTLARYGDLFPSAVNTGACMDFHPKAECKFRPMGDGRYEAVIIRKPPCRGRAARFKVFRHLKEWSTKDLFTPHATKPGVWIYASRADATSFNPLEYEALISSHPSVLSALTLGTQRQQACLLVEINKAEQALVEEVKGGKDVSTALDALWPSILQANERCTEQAAVLKSHVLFTRPEKPLPKGFKGTVQRAATTRLYAEEMEALYT